MISVGDTVDDFTLQDQHGEEIRWSSLRGRPVVVFFYPKADTPGCTTEAQGFRDARAAFDAAGVQLVGVSADSVKRQSNFDKKHELGLTLLSDPERAIIEPWGVWQDKTMYGRTSKGIVRTTVLFDADGRAVEVWSPVKVKGHVDAVLARVRAS
ncbi:MAG: thioredoxin-dependent thiol peroxidase [Bryobacterales bacterium]